MLPYGRQSIDSGDIDAVVNVLRSDWLTTGPAVVAFEAQIGKLVGGHDAVSCTSGTAALHMAYASLGISSGDEVITSPMTFIATASCASLIGATVVFADIELETGLIDPRAVEDAITNRTRVVAGVDYAGQPCDYDTLQAIADSVGATTLADAAHSIGGTDHGRPVGSLADVTTFSFFPTKNMTTGEGGALVARDPSIVAKAREFHMIGLVRDRDRLELQNEGMWHQEVHAFGLNYRLSDIAAALGLSQLRRLDHFKERRRNIRRRYLDALRDIDGLEVLKERPGVDSMWHLLPVRILDQRRHEVYDRMRAAGIFVQVNYLPVYRHPVYAQMGYRRGLCPRAEQFYEEELSLPLFVDLTDAEVDHVCETLIGILS